MSSLKDDIASARSGGDTDEYILNAYKQYDPAKAADIDAAIQGGTHPRDVLDALADYDAQYGDHIENKSLLTKAGGALQEGVASELEGIGNTAKQTIGDGAISGTLDNLGKAVAPTGYQSASEGLGDTTKSLADRAGYIPRSMAEGAPGLATDMAAGAIGARAGGAIGLLGGPFAEVSVPAGAAIGGALGFGGSYLIRHYGNDAQRAAQARTGDPNAVPDTEDKERALAAGVAEAALSRVGVTKALGAGVSRAGESMLSPTIQSVLKAGVADAGTSAAADALNTAIVDRKDPMDDPSGLLLAGAQGAAAGVGLRATTSAGDINSTVKFGDIAPHHAADLTDWYLTHDVSTPAEAYEAMKYVDRHLDLHADHWEERTQPQIDALDETSGHMDDTGVLVKQARARLSNGGVVAPETLASLEERLGDYMEGDNLVKLLNLQNTQNQLKALGNFRDGPNGTGTFGGGMGDTSFARNVLSPFGSLGKYGPRALAAEYGLEHLAAALPVPPAIATGIEAAQLGAWGIAKVTDKVLRNDNPMAEFQRYFAPGIKGAPNQSSLASLARGAMLKQRYTGHGANNSGVDDMAKVIATRALLRHA